MWRKSSRSMPQGNCLQWRKSSYSYGTGNCTEVTDGVQVRDSKNPDVVLSFSQDTWTQFTDFLK